MASKRKKHAPSFKFKVALEAAKNEKTRSQIASQFGVHASQVSQWKTKLVQEGSTLFELAQSDRKKRKEAENEADLYEQIGRLKMELEWLKKKVGTID